MQIYLYSDVISTILNIRKYWIYSTFCQNNAFASQINNKNRFHNKQTFSIYSHLIFWPLTCWIKLWGPKHTRCILALGFGHDYFTTEEALASLLCLSSTQTFQVKFMSFSPQSFLYPPSTWWAHLPPNTSHFVIKYCLLFRLFKYH